MSLKLMCFTLKCKVHILVYKIICLHFLYIRLLLLLEITVFILLKDIASQRHYNRNKCQNNKDPFLPKLHGSETIDNCR